MDGLKKPAQNPYVWKYSGIAKSKNLCALRYRTGCTCKRLIIF
jgi:hypothetical protein